MALLPIGAAWIRLVMAEQAAGEHEGRKSELVPQASNLASYSYCLRDFTRGGRL